jgi:hypothetical protein
MLSVVVFFSGGVMQLLYSPRFRLPIPPWPSKYISDKQEVFGYLETQNPRHEPRCAGGVSDNARLSESGTAPWFMPNSYPFAGGEKEAVYEGSKGID